MCVCDGSSVLESSETSYVHIDKKKKCSNNFSSRYSMLAESHASVTVKRNLPISGGYSRLMCERSCLLVLSVMHSKPLPRHEHRNYQYVTRKNALLLLGGPSAVVLAPTTATPLSPSRPATPPWTTSPPVEDSSATPSDPLHYLVEGLLGPRCGSCPHLFTPSVFSSVSEPKHYSNPLPKAFYTPLGYPLLSLGLKFPST